MSIESVVKDIQNLFKLVQEFILSDDGHSKDKVERPNPKGGSSRGFDLHVEDMIREYFESKEPGCNLKIISEEQPLPILIGKPPYAYTLIIDPVDGSDNHIHGIRSVAFAVAVIPGHQRISLGNVTHAFIGDIYTGNIFRAEMGRGAFWNDHSLPLFNFDIHELKDFCITINFDRGDLGMTENNARCLKLLETAIGNRRGGSACLDICEIARGSIGAYIDIRNELSAENFIGPALILQEAGCVITDDEGRDISQIDFSDLSRRHNIICARSDDLVEEILNII